MKFTIALALLLTLRATTAFAESWRGMLVDSKCYAAEQRNVNPTDTETAVDTDKGAEIRYCTPKAKTKSFALVGPDGSALRFDAAGDAKASAYVHAEGKQRRYEVAVTGEQNGERIQVASIVAAAER